MPVARLKRRADFLRVGRARKRWAAPGLILEVAARPPEDGDPDHTEAAPRVGFTASRKIGNAVARNRARRRLRAAVEKVMAPHAKSRRDYVIIARQATAERPFTDLMLDLETALKRLDSYIDR